MLKVIDYSLIILSSMNTIHSNFSNQSVEEVARLSIDNERI